jgi:hypothetical protein
MRNLSRRGRDKKLEIQNKGFGIRNEVCFLDFLCCFGFWGLCLGEFVHAFHHAGLEARCFPFVNNALLSRFVDRFQCLWHNDFHFFHVGGFQGASSLLDRGVKRRFQLPVAQITLLALANMLFLGFLVWHFILPPNIKKFRGKSLYSILKKSGNT